MAIEIHIATEANFPWPKTKNIYSHENLLNVAKSPMCLWPQFNYLCDENVTISHGSIN